MQRRAGRMLALRLFPEIASRAPCPDSRTYVVGIVIEKPVDLTRRRCTCPLTRSAPRVADRSHKHWAEARRDRRRRATRYPSRIERLGISNPRRPRSPTRYRKETSLSASFAPSISPARRAPEGPGSVDLIHHRGLGRAHPAKIAPGGRGVHGNLGELVSVIGSSEAKNAPGRECMSSPCQTARVPPLKNIPAPVRRPLSDQRGAASLASPRCPKNRKHQPG